MATPDAFEYFPSLDKCLNGSTQLLSWQQTYLILSEGAKGEAGSSLQSFLSDSQTQIILRRVRDPFPPQSSQSRSAFDRLTSAINVPPNTNGRYDIQQIKEDALWLSKTVQIDEVSALRLTVLEFQHRPEDEIIEEVKSSEDAGLGRSFQQPALLRSVLGASQSSNLHRSILRVDSADTSSRQLRLLAVFLKERIHAVKIRQLAVFAHKIELYLNGPGWLCGVGASLEESWSEGPGNMQGFYADLLAALELSLESLQNGCTWNLSETQLGLLAEHWLDSAAVELALNLQLLLHFAQTRTTLLPPKIVSSWFEFMDRALFFESFEMINYETKGVYTNAIQSLVAIVSVAILHPSAAVTAIDDFAVEANSSSPSNAQSYLRDSSCVDTVTNVLLKAAGTSGARKLILAGPAMFAWVVIMQTVRSYATESIEARENRQAQRALEQQHHDSDSDSIDLQSRSRSGERRRSSFGSDSEPPATLIEIIADTVQKTMPNDDPIHFFAECAVGLSSGLRAFETIGRLSTDFCTPYGHDFGGQVGIQWRCLLLQMLNSSLIWMPYSPEILGSILAVLSGGLSSSELQLECDKFPQTHPVSTFLNDERFRSQILEQALMRFPYESAPLLALVQCLGHARSDLHAQSMTNVLRSLQQRSTLTTFLIEGLADWDLADGDGVKLLSPVDVFTAFDWQINYEEGVEHAALLGWFGGRSEAPTPFTIPAGTTGRVLKSGSANEGKVVMWDCQHSALSFIGFKLQRDSKNWIRGSAMPTDILNDPILLLTSLLQAATAEEAIHVLGGCSDDLYDSADIVQVVFELSESLLYRHQAADDVSSLLVTCLGFVRTILRFLPGRVWPFLGRSGLLGLNKSESRLHVVVATSEVPSGLFPFLLEATSLFEDVVDDALSRSVERRASSKAVARFEAAEANSLSAGVTESKMGQILSQFHALMTDIFESCRSWRFAVPGQRSKIITQLSNVMVRSMRYAYDVDDNVEEAQKLFNFIAPSAAYVSDVFLASSANNSACHALLETLAEGVDRPSDIAANRERHLIVGQTVAVLRLARQLVLLRHARNQEPTVLENNLFKAVPHLLKIYNNHPSYRTYVVHLLDSLVLTAGRNESPPSLLAFVGTSTVKAFLQILHKLDGSCVNTALRTDIWRLLASAVTKRQQWFSIVLLSGSTPRETLKSSRTDSDDQLSSSSMLSLALDKASNISSLNPSEAETLLGFIAQATDFWPRVRGQVQNSKPTLDALKQYLRTFELPDHSQRSSTAEASIRSQIAAYIIDILALIVNSDAETGEKSFASSLVNSLSHLIQGEGSERSAVSNPSFNTTLHERLSQNFSTCFTNCQIDSLKRTLVPRTWLGDSFYYDLEIADATLNYDPAWSGARGFRTEVILANRNLSVVEATIKLFHSWRSLIVELSAALHNDEKFLLSIEYVILDCLKANGSNHLPETVFRRLAQARADLAFTLLQQTVTKLKNKKSGQQILSTAWEVVKGQADELGSALTGDEAQYCRTCLRTLAIALQPFRNEMSLDARRSAYSSTMDKPIAVDILMLEILRLVVARGFRSLSSALHDDASSVQPEDMALLLAMMRTILSAPSMERHQLELLNIFSDERTPTYASALFSWADRLLVDGDPVYGEIGVGILLELSTIQPLAEAIVTNGCLGQILSSNLSRVYQKGVGPFDSPVRVYSIWAKGILPLAINILSALGPLIAADVAIFINRFGGQLTRVATQFNSKDTRNHYSGMMTLTVAGEIQSLALLGKLLEACRDAGASAGVVSADIQELACDKSRLVQDVEDLLARRSALRYLIIPRDAKEESWSRAVPKEKSASSSENLLEERVVGLLSNALETLNASDV